MRIDCFLFVTMLRSLPDGVLIVLCSPDEPLFFFLMFVTIRNALSHQIVTTEQSTLAPPASHGAAKAGAGTVYCRRRPCT
jgi:hypothetical protein